MQMKRFIVVLFSQPGGAPSVKKTEYGMTPEQALQKALGLPSVDGIKAAGTLDGVAFYEYNGEEHIVQPTGF
jgi:hypothetical protein